MHRPHLGPEHDLPLYDYPIAFWEGCPKSNHRYNHPCACYILDFANLEFSGGIVLCNELIVRFHSHFIGNLHCIDYIVSNITDRRIGGSQTHDPITNFSGSSYGGFTNNECTNTPVWIRSSTIIITKAVGVEFHIPKWPTEKKLSTIWTLGLTGLRLHREDPDYPICSCYRKSATIGRKTK